MRFQLTIILLIFFILGGLSCKKEETAQEPTSSARDALHTVAKEMKATPSAAPSAVPTKINVDQPAINMTPVDADKLDSIEVVLAEPEHTQKRGEVLVYLLVYDQEQNMASSSGKLELTYTIDTMNEPTKTKQVEASMFRPQIIPGEEEQSYCFLADTIQSKPGSSVKVVARFAEKLDADDSMTLDDSSDDDDTGAPAE